MAPMIQAFVVKFRNRLQSQKGILQAINQILYYIFCKMASKWLRQANFFPFSDFLSLNGSSHFKNTAGGIVSIPLVILASILLVLKFIEFINLGTVVWTSQINYTQQPLITYISTNPSDSNSATFMAGFGIMQDSTCTGGSIKYQLTANIAQGPYNSASRTTSQVPVNFQTCTASHFSKLPGNMSKIGQWTTNSLFCLPINRYFQLGGSNTTSNLYKNLQFSFSCPASCSSNPTCGSIQFYTQNAIINVQNRSNSFSYYLNRVVIPVYNNPTYQNYMEIDASNITTDSSLLPWSTNNQVQATQVGQFITNAPVPAGSTGTNLIFERSDKTTIFRRNYWKFFDLVAWFGGLVFGLVLFGSFLYNISRRQFQMRFAAQYFRNNESKKYNFTSYLKQLIYNIALTISLKLDWKIAEKREEVKSTVNKVLDIVYLNKRIAFLEEAISIVFDQHQLKGIHLLHNLTRQQAQSRIQKHKFRDRMITYLNKKYKISNINLDHYRDKEEINNISPSRKIVSGEQDFMHTGLNQKKLIRSSCSLNLQSGQSQELESTPVQPGRLSFKMLVEKHMEKYDDNFGSSAGIIINEAEQQYMKDRKRAKNKKRHKIPQIQSLQKEIQFIGEMGSEELRESELLCDLETDLKKLVEEAEGAQKDGFSKKIYERLDVWLKNQIKYAINENSNSIVEQ